MDTTKSGPHLKNQLRTQFCFCQKSMAEMFLASVGAISCKGCILQDAGWLMRRAEQPQL